MTNKMLNEMNNAYETEPEYRSRLMNTKPYESEQEYLVRIMSRTPYSEIASLRITRKYEEYGVDIIDYSDFLIEEGWTLMEYEEIARTVRHGELQK